MPYYFRIIRSIENFAALVPLDNQSNDNTVPDEIMFSREAFAIFITVRDLETFPQAGQRIEAGSGLDISDVNFTSGSFINSSSSADTIQSLASVDISQGLFEIFQNSTPKNMLPRLIYIVYNVNTSLFQEPSGNGTGGVILSVLRSPLQGPAPSGLTEQVQFQFQVNQVCTYC